MSAPKDPIELRGRSMEELRHLAEDIRQRILTTCLKNGGHLGASLGAVEIAIALHRVFESPQDAIVWDVGHQAYAHKLLTGRWDRFETLRKDGGISGFLSREESPHDIFGAGHSSTALSAALGIAWAKGRSRPARWTAAVVGDGGLTAGLALEALNNARAAALGPLVLVLNDNQMSISPNVGSISTLLASGEAPAFFEAFGFDYVGPLDGHDLAALIPALEAIRDGYAGRPVVVHAITQKGKGYAPAEERPAFYHGIGPAVAKIPDQPAPIKHSSYSDAFGEALCRLAESDPRVVAITAAMPEGTGLVEFARRFPDRFFDVGIAEAHAVTFAAGLATQGMRPVVAIYSTFLQRALDSIIHDVVLQGLGVTLAIDRAGVVGADGPTHHGAFDLAYLGMIPGLALHAPSGLGDLDELLTEAVASGKPVAIRYPRGGGAAVFEPQPEGGVRWHARVADPKLVVVALGAAAARLPESVADATVISTTAAKPIAGALKDYLVAHPAAALLTIEDGAIHGGFGQSLLGETGGGRRFRALGYEDRFITHGTPAELEELAGVSRAAIARAAAELAGR